MAGDSSSVNGIELINADFRKSNKLAGFGSVQPCGRVVAIETDKNVVRKSKKYMSETRGIYDISTFKCRLQTADKKRSYQILRTQEATSLYSCPCPDFITGQLHTNQVLKRSSLIV